MYTPHDNLGIVATLKSDGTIDKTVVASVAEALPLDSENETAYSRLKEILQKTLFRWQHLRLQKRIQYW